MNNNYRTIALRSLAAGVLSVALVGCSDSITAPNAGVAPAAQDEVATATSGDLAGWTLIAEKQIPVGRQTTLHGSRYSVMFTKGVLHHAVKVSMYELSPGRIDVNLEPDGIYFQGPVYLTIDYSGTRFDPDAPNYSGLAPQAGKYDSAAGEWKSYPGTVSTVTKTITLPLFGFSRYGVIPADGGPGRDPEDNFEQSGLN